MDNSSSIASSSSSHPIHHRHYHSIMIKESKESTKSAVLQDVLFFFKRHNMLNWTCTIAPEMSISPVNVDYENRIIHLCPWFLTHVDYKRASYKVLEVLDNTFFPYENMYQIKDGGWDNFWQDIESPYFT